MKKLLKDYAKKTADRVFLHCLQVAAKDLALCDQIDALRDSANFARQHFAQARVLRDRWEIIDFALVQTRVPGLFLECGVFRGESLNYIARRNKDRTIHGFDSFEGLPEDWRPGYGRGTFKIASPHELAFERNVKIHRGWFSETVNRFAQTCPENVAFLHIDCDLYSSTVDILTLLGSRITRGTIILFDEYYNHPGWREHEHKAFVEFVEKSAQEFRYIAYNSASEQVAVEML
jgi:hypothetical protein